ncbi:MAG TPA: pyrroline-5-carboxylate reductase [Steroidobacteraceae bacterium]|nr:pyrroline-5-carboxylate reductase [Steroidobacteraceae bacterium]
MTAPASLPITLIGGGNMARALIGGLLGQGLSPALITVAEPAEAVRAALAGDFGVATTADNAAAAARARVVVLAVKPQVMAPVARGLAATLQATRPLVISVAAGIRTVDLANWIGAGVPLVRAMPNRPALVGLGATGLYAAAETGASERELADRLLAATGLVVWVPRESDLELVTALSGSGPAYFFRLAQLMAECGAALGLDPEASRQLAAQTLAGAGRLVAAERTPDLARMSAEVASKGGTTEAALERFAALGLDRLVAAAMQAAAERGRELAAQSGRG